MTRLPSCALALAVCAPAAAPAVAGAATTSYPSISRVSPLKLGVGDTLTIKGKSFRAGHARTTVVFKRDGGRAIFVKAQKATKTTLTVVIPGKMVNSLLRTSGQATPTRFRLRALTSRLGRRYTSASGSPTIGPTALTSKVVADDCDGDLVPNAKDTDDDNDLLADTLEKTIGTDPCKRDTDGDSMSDGWEHESALDYNDRAKPSPSKRPYPNALDAKDAAVDSDGDAMTNAQEYAAWMTFGADKLPLSYSGGNPATGGKTKPAAGYEWADRDHNGFITDNERDADHDGLPNQEEDLVDGLEGKVVPKDARGRTLGVFSLSHIEQAHDIINDVPLYGPLKSTQKVLPLNWLDADSDGDGVRDGDDDQDGDGLSNVKELLDEIGGTGPSQELPINSCAPDLDARLCIGDDDLDNDSIPNRTDEDDDGDLLPDVTERKYGLNPYDADTDGDDVPDGYEFRAAKDLNGAAIPYPSKKPWPNPLDPSDVNSDFDGDGLALWQEHKLWRYLDRPVTAGDRLGAYSDGTQNTGGQVPASDARLNDRDHDALDRDRDGNLTDDERDADRDGLSNQVEFNTSGTQAWWKAVLPDEKPYIVRSFNDLDAVDPDTDGDGIDDGHDDQDNDGYDNRDEMQRSRARIGLRVQPFNPCLPDPHSITCSRYVPVDPATRWPPFDGSEHAYDPDAASPSGSRIPFTFPDSTTTDPALAWDGKGGHQGLEP